jgi:hypothetical protein
MTNAQKLQSTEDEPDILIFTYLVLLLTLELLHH